MYEYIVNPRTGRKVSVYGKLGQSIIRNYITQAGGFIRGGIRMPSCDAYASSSPSQEGGGCTDDSECEAHKDGRNRICNSKTGRCVLENGASGKQESGRRGGKSSVKKATTSLAARRDARFKSAKKTPFKTSKEYRRIHDDSVGYTTKLNYCNFRKTKDPKCDDQPGCHWVVGKGCQGRQDLRQAALDGEEVSSPKVVRSVRKSSPKTVREKYPCDSGIFAKTKEPKCDDQPGCHWVVRKGCVSDDSDEHSEESIPVAKAAPRRETPPMAKATPRRETPPMAKAPSRRRDGLDVSSELSQEEIDARAARFGVKKASPKKSSAKKSMVKTVTTKGKGTTQRLSAGDYYRAHGEDSSIGDICDIRKDGDYRCMLKRSNGTPYWAKPSKSGKGQEACEPWESKCQEHEFA